MRCSATARRRADDEAGRMTTHGSLTRRDRGRRRWPRTSRTPRDGGDDPASWVPMLPAAESQRTSNGHDATLPPRAAHAGSRESARGAKSLHSAPSRSTARSTIRSGTAPPPRATDRSKPRSRLHARCHTGRDSFSRLEVRRGGLAIRAEASDRCHQVRQRRLAVRRLVMNSRPHSRQS